MCSSPTKAFLRSYNLAGGLLRLAIILVVSAALAFVPRTFAQATIQTLFTNGPVSNSLNIVVLSEGYTSNQLAKFITDAGKAVDTMLTYAPYAEYRSYCNAYAIAVASQQPGSDHPNSGIKVNTYFNSTYDKDLDRVITIPPNSVDGNASHGQGKVDALLDQLMPQYGLAILLVNDLVPGGSDGFGKTALSSIAATSADILTHETGHVLAGLGDEYSTPYTGAPTAEEPNTTKETRPAFIKWKAWIEEGTPIPTPASQDYAAVIGLFQGAHYNTTGWYRPKLNCLMRSQGVPFCEVCSEAMVLAFYRAARPVDSFLPEAASFVYSTPPPLTFELSLKRPASHALTVRWWLDGSPVSDATSQTLTLEPNALANTRHTVKALVSDPTPLVRNDPGQSLSQEVAWTFDANLPVVDQPRLLAGGRFVFRVQGNAALGAVVENSSNFFDWMAVSTNSLPGGETWCTNLINDKDLVRYFRARSP